MPRIRPTVTSQNTDEMPRICGKRNQSSHNSKHVYTVPLLKVVKVIFVHCFNGAVCHCLTTVVKFTSRIQHTCYQLWHSHIPYLFLSILYGISYISSAIICLLYFHSHSVTCTVQYFVFFYTVRFFFHYIPVFLLYLFIFIFIIFL